MSNANGTVAGPSPALIEKLRKVLALTSSPSEGEAHAAAKMLARLLAQHNLDVADLEAKGQAAQAVGETKIDLGKAAWAWKVQLAGALGKHFFCGVIQVGKNPVFVGRPDNVESLRMLYAWLTEQVQAVAREERRAHAEKTGEHVDPLRWQLHFGLGAVARLAERLEERRVAEATKAGTALMVVRGSEVSDFLEERYGFRQDGQPTKREREDAARRAANQKRWDEEDRLRNKLRLECQASGNMEPYYKLCPWERPEPPETEEQKARRLKREAADARKRERESEAWCRRQRRQAEREAEREWRRSQNPENRRKRRQAEAAEESGGAAADRINLEPFIECDGSDSKGAIS